MYFSSFQLIFFLVLFCFGVYYDDDGDDEEGKLLVAYMRA